MNAACDIDWLHISKGKALLFGKWLVLCVCSWGGDSRGSLKIQAAAAILEKRQLLLTVSWSIPACLDICLLLVATERP